MGRKKKATTLPLQPEKIPSSTGPSGKSEGPAPEQTQEDLSKLGSQYHATREGDSPDAPKKERSAYRARKEAEAQAEEAKRADIQATGEAFGDAYCQLLDLLFARSPNPQPLTDFERAANRKAVSRVAVKYIGVDFKYKEEIVLLTVTAVTVIPRFIRSKE